MKILISLWLAMSLSGTVCFLGYLLISFLADKYISAGFRYAALKLCLALFLIPFPMIKHLMVRSMDSPKVELSHNPIYYYYTSETIHQTDEGFYVAPFTVNQRVLLAIWLFVFAVLIFHQTYRYFRFKSTLDRSASEDFAHVEMLMRLKNQKKLGRQIKLYFCEAPISPFTCGIFRPAILLTSLVHEDSIELALKHELQHIKSHDFIFRIFAMLAVYLHCFNPIIYFFFRELKEVQEMNCDEKLYNTFSEKEKKDYGHMVIDIASHSEKVSVPAVYFTKNNASFLRKRIEKMAAYSRKQPVLLCGLFFLLGMLSSIPVFAYSPQTIDLRGTDISKEYLEEVDWILDEFPVEDENIMAIPEDEMTFQYYDEYILTDDGEIITDFDNFSSKAACLHTYQHGIRKAHKINGEGCSVTVYDVSMCSKCGDIKEQTFLSTTTYAVCPHK